MKISQDIGVSEPALAALFTATFSASEGPEEGAIVGALAARLMEDTPREDLRTFFATDGAGPIAAVIFTPLVYPQDPRRVMLLSPMAVATDHQGQGVGQALLTHALDALRSEGVDVAITYGDPAFYSKVGFQPLTAAQAAPPHPLSQPQGWIGQSLTGQALTPLKGPSTCVSGLNDPALW
ncbi:MAG: N-acetyltransferase [Pseudomonadota bacterium]